MENIRSLIKEVLTKITTKKSCNCGCHSCDNVGNPGPVLNESLDYIPLTENFDFHVQNKLPLTENTFRYGSNAFLNLWAEARYLYVREAVHLNDVDKEILLETDLGEYGIYEGVKVPLDMPMLEEENGIECEKCSHEWIIRPEDNHPLLCHNCGYDNGKNKYDLEAFEEWKSLQESKDKKKNPPLGKPKRGGSKKFFVYVKNPKTKKIKKVSFGGTTGLSVKINDPEARRAFAARHDCKNKKDRTKPSYWSCNIGRYWKQLGGSNNFSGYW
jgi:hypothetical protein